MSNNEITKNNKTSLFDALGELSVSILIIMIVILTLARIADFIKHWGWLIILKI